MARNRRDDDYGDDDRDERPHSRRRDDDEEEDRPSRRSRSRDDDDEEPRSRRKNRDDEDEEDRPSRSKSRRDDEEDEPRGGKSKSKFEYGGGRSYEDTQRHVTQRSGSWESCFKDEFKEFKAREGDNIIRFLPSTWGDKRDFMFSYWRHENIGPDKSSFVCLNKQFGKKCPICDGRSEFAEEDQKDLRPRRRWVAWVVDREHEGEGPMLWDISPKMDKNISNLVVDNRRHTVLNIEHPEEGYDVEFKRTGTRLNTEYSGMRIQRDNSPIHDNEKRQERWLDFINENPLDTILVIQDYEYIEKAFAGQLEKKDKDLDEDEDDEDRPRQRRGRGRDRDSGGKKSIRDEIDDEIPEDGPAQSRRGRNRDDDDEEEKPRGGRTRMKRDDDDEEDPPFEGGKRSRRNGRDDDEEEDRPRRSRSRSRDDDEDAEEEDVSDRTRNSLRSRAEQRRDEGRRGSRR